MFLEKLIATFKNDPTSRSSSFKSLLLYLSDNFKNLFNLLRSSIAVNMFLSLEEDINSLTPVGVKKLFVINSTNILQYHPIVIQNIDKKDKVIKLLCNKILLALKLDLYGNGRFVDFYNQILEALKDDKSSEMKIPKKRKKTVRGGLKKKMKKWRQMEEK
ncbi:hypothetical protein NGRA_0272 [Nosema granulosis]|uniref:Uncharacterized protein n=1 Tax=Nosema granulosis TaxID=83296 RepID=A0A9P6H170_9MICR|nr:hypothetical protein NGRA_0272 [Nosema granulosis]